MSYRKSNLSRRADGQYLRTIGKAYNTGGELKPKRFLLGKDLRQAEAANLLLERLWDLVVQDFESLRQEDLAYLKRGGELLRSPQDPVPVTYKERQQEPVHWSRDYLQVAEAARQARTTASVVRKPKEKPSAYVKRLDRLQQALPSFHITAPPQDQDAASRGRGLHAANARDKAQEAVESARVAQTSVPRQLGQTLYAALDAYAKRVINGRESGKVEAATALRLKQAIPDMDLGELGYSALEGIQRYWTARPEAKLRSGKSSGHPISIATVDRHLSVARRFVRWLDRSDAYKWEMPRHGLEALQANLQRLRTEVEVSKLRSGALVFSVDQLTTLWRHATDTDRLFVLLGLNAAMSHAEIISLRHDEVESATQTIKRIRGKSGVYGEFALWPETQAALAWWRQFSTASSDLVLNTREGRPYTRQRIANQWAALYKRIARAEQDNVNWWLPFKHLRKTAAQFVRDASDGEVAGVFLSHGHL